MTFQVLIPARLASTRLPRKPLADICGVPMVVRVARQAAQSSATAVTVAADDAEIVAACARHGIRALLTGREHASGSDRLAEACDLLGLAAEAIVVNVQGDEPFVEPELIDAAATLLQARPDCVMSTIAHRIASAAEFADPNIVKVVLDAAGCALYFSRASIPWPRDVDLASAVARFVPLRHAGLYAYRAGFLARFPSLPPAPLETIERLEQLRVLWHGERIAVHVSELDAGVGVDTPEDLELARQAVASRNAGFA